MNATSVRFARRPRQHGSVMLMFVLMLPILLGFTALAVDFSRVLLAKQELQNAADAAALAGAAGLDDPGGETPYNWTAANNGARQFIGKNPVSGRVLTDGTVTVGYTRPGDPLKTIYSPYEPGIQPFDVPSVRVDLSLSVGQNGGPLNLLFGPLLGTPSMNINAFAIASAYPPGYAAAGSLFPIVLNRCLYDLYWDYTTRSPKLDPATKKPYVINVGSVYGTTCNSGQWTTFNTVLNDVPSVLNLIANGNPVALGIGNQTYIQTGVEASVYKSVPYPKNVAVLVVDKVNPGSNSTIVAIAAFQIQGTTTGSNKQVTGSFTEGLKAAGLSAGSGGGQDLGAQTGIPSILIQ
jgi:type II secretory pathway pseudopilin PulG